MTKNKHTTVLGFEIDLRTPSELIEDILNHVGNKQDPLRIIQINPEMMVSLLKDRDKYHLLSNVDITVANGVGLQWATTYMKQKPGIVNLLKTLSWVVLKPERIKKTISSRYTSSSFTAPLLKQLSLKKAHVLIAGSPKGAKISDSARWLRGVAPGLKISSFDTVDFDYVKQTELTQKIKKTKPDLVILAIGFPVQERAAKAVMSKMSSGVVLTEGGTFDYKQFGGKFLRAPKIVQKFGLEWLWRLILEPWRIKRQFSLVFFIRYVYKNHK